jgi:hypothetical protein
MLPGPRLGLCVIETMVTHQINNASNLKFYKKLNENLRKKRREDFTHNWIVIERHLLHFANGSQKTSSSVDSSGLQRSLQGFEDGVLIFANFSIKKKFRF